MRRRPRSRSTSPREPRSRAVPLPDTSRPPPNFLRGEIATIFATDRATCLLIVVPSSLRDATTTAATASPPAPRDGSPVRGPALRGPPPSAAASSPARRLPPRAATRRPAPSPARLSPSASLRGPAPSSAPPSALRPRSLQESARVFLDVINALVLYLLCRDSCV